jgi:ABC-type Na+ efflux pump permease subunit
MNRIPSVWHSIKVIFKKETQDGLRDWRALLTTLFIPVMGPLMVIWLFSTFVDVSTEPEHITIPVAGSDNAPGLISWLESKSPGSRFEHQNGIGGSRRIPREDCGWQACDH